MLYDKGERNNMEKMYYVFVKKDGLGFDVHREDSPEYAERLADNNYRMVGYSKSAEEAVQYAKDNSLFETVKDKLILHDSADDCPLCFGFGKMERKEIEMKRRVNGVEVVYSDVPAKVCTHCGEALFTGSVADAINSHLKKIRDNGCEEGLIFPFGTID